MIAGADPYVVEQLEKTGVLDRLGRENVYTARARFGQDSEQAH